MDQNKIFHCCFNKNRDSTNRVIAPGEKCITPTRKYHFGNILKTYLLVSELALKNKNIKNKKNLPKPNFKKILKKNLWNKWLNSSENLSTELEISNNL